MKSKMRKMKGDRDDNKLRYDCFQAGSLISSRSQAAGKEKIKAGQITTGESPRAVIVIPTH
jgi:hypothetical protein